MKPALLKEVIRSLFSKPATIQYPKQLTPVEPDARGRHHTDLNKCIGCSLCMIECPANAIIMKKIPKGYEEPERNPKKIYPSINYLKCVYCYRCVTVCPTNAYVTTSEYRLGTSKPIFSDDLSLKTLGGGKRGD